MRTLYVIAKNLNKDANSIIRQKELDDDCPRSLIVEDSLNADVIDERYLSTFGSYRNLLYRYIPVEWSQIIEILLIRNAYDIVFVHTEKTGLLLAWVFKVLRIRIPLVIAVSRITSKKPSRARRKMWLLKKTKHHINRLITWSVKQRDIMVQRSGVASSRITVAKLAVDQKFWRPIPCEINKICSAGKEMRDYPTLIKALDGLHIPCHITTGETRGLKFDTLNCLKDPAQLADNITVSKKSITELRTLYASSLFVVVPLLKTDTNNGMTTILEAMAMGKAVICSKVEGDSGIIQDGVTGIYVDQGNPEALREAMLSLWHNPARAAEIGHNARRYIEQHHNMEDWADNLYSILNKTIAESRLPKSARYISYVSSSVK